MKTISKLSLIAATVAAIANSAALADNSTLRTLIDLDRQKAERNKKTTTVAVYADRHGVTQRSAMQDVRSETRFEWRTNANGQRFGIFAPVK